MFISPKEFENGLKILEDTSLWNSYNETTEDYSDLEAKVETFTLNLNSESLKDFEYLKKLPFLLRTEITFKFKIEECLKIFKSPNFIKGEKHVDEVKFFDKEFEEIEENKVFLNQLVYSSTKKSIAIDVREFICAHKLMLFGGKDAKKGYILLEKTINLEDKYPKKKGKVRAERWGIEKCFEVDKEKGIIKFISIESTDLKGWIPQFIINTYFKADSKQKWINFKNQLDYYYKNNNECCN
jgi:hypothetical protein